MDEAHRQTDKELAKIERKLRTLYGRASLEAQDKANRFWEQFNKLDAIKRKQVQEGKLDKNAYIEWRKNKTGMFTGYYLPLVNALAADMTNVNQIAASIVRGHLPEVYANNFNYGTYQIERDARIDTTFTLYDRQTVERLVRSNPDIIPIKPRVDIPKDLLWNKQKINAEITTGILTGDSIPDIAKRLKKVADMNQVAAVRTARTATTAAENGGRVDSYRRAQSMGIKLAEQWVATLDQVTRASHVDLDGETIPVAKDKWHYTTFSNGCRYPGDPLGPPEEIYNCRCTLIADVEGVDQGKIDDLGLRNTRKLGDMSYEEWKEGHQKQEPKPTPEKKAEKPKKDKIPRDYTTDIAKGMIQAVGKDKYNKALDLLEACSSRDVQKAYLFAWDKIDLASTTHTGTAYQNSGAIYLNAAKDATGSAYRAPFETLFHESGHGTDYYIMREWKRVLRSEGQVSSIFYGHFYSTTWQDNKLGRTITDEVQKKVNALHKQILTEYEKSKFDVGWWQRIGVLTKWDVQILESRAHSKGYALEEWLRILDKQGRMAELGLSKPRKETAYKALEEEIRNLLQQEGGYMAAGSLSDIVEGATKGRIQAGVGHGKSYWKRIGVEVEAFAEMSEAYTSGSASLRTLREYLPESMAVFDEMMADAVKIIEKGAKIP